MIENYGDADWKYTIVVAGTSSRVEKEEQKMQQMFGEKKSDAIYIWHLCFFRQLPDIFKPLVSSQGSKNTIL